MKTSNRRESPRIDIRLRCHITSPALWSAGAVYTENISRSGLLIVWRGEGLTVTPATGQLITVDVELPANHGFGQKCIHCQGAVIRVTRAHEDGHLVALRVNYMDFRAFHDQLRTLQTLQPVAASWMA